MWYYVLGQTKFNLNIRNISTSKLSAINYHQRFCPLPNATQLQYTGPIHCIRDIVSTHGVKGLYKGCCSMIIRDIPGYVIYFLPYFYLCKLFRKKDEYQTRPVGLILAGGLSGVLSWGIMHPIDTIKSRFVLLKSINKVYITMMSFLECKQMGGNIKVFATA